MHIFENPKIKTAKMRNSLMKYKLFLSKFRHFKEENSFTPKVVSKSVQTHELERIVADIEFSKGLFSTTSRCFYQMALIV